MSNNVLILGAGFSHDAGIPLLGGFVEKMWELSVRKSNKGDQLSEEDSKIFDDAIKVKNELDSYHGRAVFDDRNIEDILSILAFNVVGGGKGDKDKLNMINRAIARTIELSCSVTHPGVSKTGQNSAINTGPGLYRSFWRNLFERAKTSTDLPTIITFNYDLVLERSLLQLLIGTHYDNYKNRIPFRSFELKYFYDRLPTISYLTNYSNFTKYTDSGPKTSRGTILNPLIGSPTSEHIEVEILKLHGSLNFPKSRAKFESSEYNFANSIDDPQILPPISNKMSGNTSDNLWKIAIQRLREAKNVVIVGYSLPRTDIYMQYFLKAALGPNMDLNKITVFDPVLYSNSPENKEMRNRYQDCFAPQLHKRINFNLNGANIGQIEKYGTAEQFVEVIGSAPDIIFF